MDTVNILGFPVSVRGLAVDADQAVRALDAGGRAHCVMCANPHSLVEAGAEPAFAAALANAESLLPDGAGVVLAARLLGTPLTARVAGADFFAAVTQRAETRGGLKVFFLGSSEPVLARIVARHSREYPHVTVCGTYAPPFKSEFTEAETAAMIAAVNAAKPHILWVGMTAPKQERWIHENRTRLNAGVIGAIGAVFDFYAGTKQRAPQWICDLGLEWLPRLVREPRRLWRRSFVSAPIFVGRVLRQRFGRTPTPAMPNAS